MIWLIPLLDNFPRNRRFTLGERLETGLIEILELLVEAAYAKTKQDVLRRANLRLAVVRHLWRMAHELQTISTKRYAHGAKLLEDLGKQIGGWLKSIGEP
ncbi:MAG: diversity-generating retroelement protein Avd [Gammaproteobacteria bacterium]|nr:diversity-generating retroelement protein Avd [Gammaproteobacteria bacterium]